MLEVRCCVHRSDETLDILLIVGEITVEDLERDRLAVANVLGLVDRPRLPLGDDRSHLVVTDLAGQTGGRIGESPRRLLSGVDRLGIRDPREVDLDLGLTDPDRVARILACPRLSCRSDRCLMTLLISRTIRPSTPSTSQWTRDTVNP